MHLTCAGRHPCLGCRPALSCQPMLSEVMGIVASRTPRSPPTPLGGDRRAARRRARRASPPRIRGPSLRMRSARLATLKHAQAGGACLMRDRIRMATNATLPVSGHGGQRLASCATKTGNRLPKSDKCHHGTKQASQKRAETLWEAPRVYCGHVKDQQVRQT